MSSTKSVISAEAMARLRKDTKFAMSAKKAVNQFNNFSGPPGRYFARLQRLDFRFHKTGGHACFTFYHTCLAKCPDAGSDSNIIDQQHAGMAMKVYREVKVTEKMTIQDAWDAAMVDLQAYDIKTRNFGVRNGVEVQDNGETFWKDLGDALDALQERRPAVIIDVSEGKPQPGKPSRNFVNVRETVAEEIVSRFASPQIEVSDDDMEVPDEAAESSADEAAPTVEEQLAMIMGLDREKLIEALESQDVKFPWDNMSLAQIQQIGLAFVKDEQLPSPESFAATGGGKGELSDEEEGESSDDEEEDEPAAPRQQDMLMKLQNTIANESRDALKTRLRGMGALLPADKFKKPDVQSDDFLRQWIIDVFTGQAAPAMIVAPDELPPF